MLLLIDNYDSFVHNLARYFERLGQETHVVRNDAMDVSRMRALQPDAIILSPGPCTPTEAGCSLAVVRELSATIPMLGVCLGHQTIAAALGGRIVRAHEPLHGRTSQIDHDRQGLFRDVPNPLTVCRYHSLMVEEATLPNELKVIARTADGTIMALAHQTRPLFGVQFHPESILTQHGYEMLANFLHLAQLVPGNYRPSLADELMTVEPAAVKLPSMPVTF